ncbi:transposase (plasmid) [Bacillus mycoides]|nr:transposase [Bacillus mycoides]
MGVEEYDCPSCSTHHDRDRNASMNLLKLAK